MSFTLAGLSQRYPYIRSNGSWIVSYRLHWGSSINDWTEGLRVSSKVSMDLKHEQRSALSSWITYWYWRAANPKGETSPSMSNGLYPSAACNIVTPKLHISQGFGEKSLSSSICGLMYAVVPLTPHKRLSDLVSCWAREKSMIHTSLYDIEYMIFWKV